MSQRHPLLPLPRSRRLATLVVGAVLVSCPISAAPESSADAAREMFDRLKGLEGRWETVSTAGWAEVTTYEVIARGSVLMSATTFAEAPERKMVTMFHLDGDRLVLTHYCEARNQPRLEAKEIDLEGGSVAFVFADGTNLPDRDHGHMDSALFALSGEDTYRSRWSWYESGENRWMEEIVARRIHD